VERCTTNYKIYCDKWGKEKATATIIRNPNILQVPSIGYGSAEAAEDETIYVSYIVAATRPFGKPLLATLLFLLAYKPVIAILATQ